MSTAPAVAAAAVLIWLGMVLAISFVEAPLKFRAPGITVPLGLGIGRIVFRALNGIEVVLAAVAAIALSIGPAPSAAAVTVAAGAALLLVQIVAIRPTLSRRSDAVLAAADPDAVPRSHAHLWYVAAETLKVVALVVGGWLLLTA